jgi:flavorubredoxin
MCITFLTYQIKSVLLAFCRTRHRDRGRTRNKHFIDKNASALIDTFVHNIFGDEFHLIIKKK